MKAEDDIRAAAALLADAIQRGRSEGLTVQWPSKSEGLRSIEISHTGAVVEPAAPPPKARRSRA